MNLIEFINKRKAELDAFANDWMLHAKEDPDNWPLYMDRGEWDEQEMSSILEENKTK